MADINTIQPNIWSKAIRMSVDEIVGFQLLIHCYTASIRPSELGMKVLILIGMRGECDLNKFCKALVRDGLFSQEQGARNLISRLEDKGLVHKREQENTNRKLVFINPDIGIQKEAPVFVDIKALYQ